MVSQTSHGFLGSPHDSVISMRWKKKRGTQGRSPFKMMIFHSYVTGINYKWPFSILFFVGEWMWSFPQSYGNNLLIIYKSWPCLTIYVYILWESLYIVYAVGVLQWGLYTCLYYSLYITLHCICYGDYKNVGRTMS